MKLGLSIRAIRNARGMKIRDASQKAHVSNALWSLVEAGKKSASVSILNRMASTLDIPSDVLMILAYGGSMTTSDKRALAILQTLKAWHEANNELIAILKPR